jgi:bifunctional non-homologous end joining protein LigD
MFRRYGSCILQWASRILQERLAALAAAKSPFNGTADAATRGAQWVKPEMVVEVSFTEWSKSGHVRHPVFHGLREDKPAKFRVSNPERVIDPSTGATKIEQVRFYGLVGPLVLEHLKGRPVSLVRAPAGIAGELFFQKHLDKGEIAGGAAARSGLEPGPCPTARGGHRRRRTCMSPLLRSPL